MTLLSTQYKTPRHPSYRSNPFTTIPHPTGNPLRAKKNPPSFTCTRIVSNLFSRLLSVYIWVSLSASVRRAPRVLFLIFSGNLQRSKSKLLSKSKIITIYGFRVSRFGNERSTIWKKRKFAFREKKSKRKEKERGENVRERKTRGSRLTSIIDGKKKEKKNRRVMFSRRNFSSDEFLSFSLSSVLQYASARLLLIFQRPFSSRFYRLWLKNLYRETAKQLVVKRLSSTMRRKCACSRFNGIDWVWSKSPFGQIISTHFRFRRPVPIPDEGISRGKKEKEKKKKGRRSLISFPDRQFEIQF